VRGAGSAGPRFPRSATRPAATPEPAHSMPQLTFPDAETDGSAERSGTDGAEPRLERLDRVVADSLPTRARDREDGTRRRSRS
jgi:hypothetical protein